LPPNGGQRRLRPHQLTKGHHMNIHAPREGRLAAAYG